MNPETTVVPVMPWTGERMVPHAADPATELFHWQRYLYFRPWYQGAKVIDAASGEGYGTNYASVFASQAEGLDLSTEAVEHAQKRYPHASFTAKDVCEADYSEADLVVSFETIEHLPDPIAFLRSLKSCNGRIVISTPNRKTHSPGNRLEDKPLNSFHTVEWTPNEFAEIIRNEFEGRQVRFLSQEGRWPGLIREGLDDDAMYCIAVIGDGDIPKWPRLGLSMPTHNNAAHVAEAVMALSKGYPGEIEFAVVANGCDSSNLTSLRNLRDSLPYMIHLLEEEENLGYGVGANRGIEHLWQEGWFDYFGVVNDDVLPATDCVSEMVSALQELEKLGHKPGMIGPVSNEVSGQQQIDIGGYDSYQAMMYRAEQHHRSKHSSATQVFQLRGLFLLIHPECLNEIGGFDPRFGIGNFEDDDYNLRARLAGFSLWIADGAYLHHHGSSTFKKLKIDYEANIQRNCEAMVAKWGLTRIEDWPAVDATPEGVSLYVPLTARPPKELQVVINGEPLDLIHQASDIEFAAWVMNQMNQKPRDVRRAVVEALASEPIGA
jgi:GT2 family glycosyltransferase